MMQVNPSEIIQAEISINGPENLLIIISESLQPEINQPSSDRSKIDISKVDKSLTIILEALDISALRAALNSYLHWINAILEAVERVQ